MQTRNAGDAALELLRGASGFFLVALGFGVVGLGSAGVALFHALAGALRQRRSGL